MRKKIQVPYTREALSLVSDVTYAHMPHWYGVTERDLHMSILRPKVLPDEPRPLVVWFCGGAYAVMDWNIHIPDLVYLARAGYIVASVQYRVSGEALYPAPIEDAKAAIRYLRAHAAKYGIDPDRIAVMGESAGAHLACMAGVLHDPSLNVGDYLDVSSRVQAVVEWYGPTMKFAPADDVRGFSWNPTDYIDDTTPPFMILHGNRDQLVPFAQGEEIYDALCSKGVDAEFIELDGATHGDANFIQPEVEALIVDFLDRHLKG